MQVGRSGRFGHLGLAVNLITYDDRFNLCAVIGFRHHWPNPHCCAVALSLAGDVCHRKLMIVC